MNELHEGKVVKEILLNGIDYSIKDRKRVYYTENENGCWECFSHPRCGGRNKSYIKITVQKRQSYLHRESYKTYNGEIPKGMVVMHTCDNTICCNPKHLKIGTSAENTEDKVNKNRQLKGSNVGNSILKENDVLKILKYRESGMLEKEIAIIFNVSRCTINSILSGKIWNHITGIKYDKNKWGRAEFQSGEIGVKWNKKSNLWMVVVKGKYVGMYKTLEDAIKSKYEYIKSFN